VRAGGDDDRLVIPATVEQADQGRRAADSANRDRAAWVDPDLERGVVAPDGQEPGLSASLMRSA